MYEPKYGVPKSLEEMSEEHKASIEDFVNRYDPFLECVAVLGLDQIPLEWFSTADLTSRINRRELSSRQCVDYFIGEHQHECHLSHLSL